MKLGERILQTGRTAESGRRWRLWGEREEPMRGARC